MTMIHPTAIVHPKAQVAASVRVGAYTVIGPDVFIDEDCVIESHVAIDKFTRIGKRNHIFPFASVGADCQDQKYKHEETWLHIGDDNVIRESCTLHRGTVQDKALTVLGDRNLLMVNTHIAHDCVIANDCIFANNVGVAGHVRVADYAIIGGNSGVHQFCQIGAHCMIGGGSTILKDVPAFVMVSGNPAHAHGVNTEGLKRRGRSAETILLIRQAYKILYKQNLTKQQAIDVLIDELLPQCAEIGLIIDDLKRSARGIVR